MLLRPIRAGGERSAVETLFLVTRRGWPGRGMGVLVGCAGRGKRSFCALGRKSWLAGGGGGGVKTPANEGGEGGTGGGIRRPAVGDGVEVGGGAVWVGRIARQGQAVAHDPHERHDLQRLLVPPRFLRVCVGGAMGGAGGGGVRVRACCACVGTHQRVCLSVPKCLCAFFSCARVFARVRVCACVRCERLRVCASVKACAHGQRACVGARSACARGTCLESCQTRVTHE